jgi:hypothetical protein
MLTPYRPHPLVALFIGLPLDREPHHQKLCSRWRLDQAITDDEK